MRDSLDGKRNWTAGIAGLVILGLAVSFPFWGGDYDVVLVTRVLCFAILGLSMDLLWGYTGLLSFGHGAFFGMGSYIFGLTLKYMSFSGIAYIGIVFGILGPMVVAAILGYFLFYGRVSGIYFGIITLALTLILQALVNHPDAFEITGGQNGLYGPFLTPRYGIPGLWEFKRTLRSNFASYYTALGGLFLAFVFCRVLVKSFFGKVLRAIKNNEDRLEFLGYNVANYKIAIFCIACGLAGFAGSISVPTYFIGPTVFGLIFSTSVLIWVAVGGRGTLVGPILGALIVTYLQSWLSGHFEYMWELFMGIFFVLMIVFQPDAIMGLPKRFRGSRLSAKGDNDKARRVASQYRVDP
jgi:urea transport system permease protein